MSRFKTREEYFGQKHLEVEGFFPDMGYEAYVLGETGQIVFECTVNSGVPGDTVEIAQITDVHFNYCNKEDETDAEVMYTKECRKFMANGASVYPCDRAMEAAEFLDQTVVTGDILDYSTKGAAELAKKHIFNVDKNVICTVGGHDITKQMQTGRPDKLSAEELNNILKEFWPHDIFYKSKEVGKVIVVGLHNGNNHYYDCQVEQLKLDIEKARKANKIVLIFQHEPLATRRPEDNNYPAIMGFDPHFINFYDEPWCQCSVKHKSNAADLAIYDLITKNADVVKGIFAGHCHSLIYIDMPASYTDESGTHSAIIPQYILAGNPYRNVGILGRIIVK